jgi:hypothetical protein
MLTVALVTAAIAALRGMWSPCGLSMLTSLNPVSEAARGHRFWGAAVEYVAGAVLGGAVLGTGCAAGAYLLALADPPARVLWVLALVAALVGVGSDTRVFGRSLPDHPRQVDERWLVKYRRWIYAGGYGVQIGTGFATYIMTAAVYLTTALAVLTASPAAALSVGLTFGAVRGLLILVSAGARTPERLRAAHQRIAALAGPSLWAAIAVQAAVAVVAAGAVAGPVGAGAIAVLVGLAGGVRARPGIEWGRLRFSR